MAKLTDRACANTKPHPDKDILLGDTDGLRLRIRPGGTRVWIIDYLVQSKRRKISIGNYDATGGLGSSVDELLTGGMLSLAQARVIASAWKSIRRAGRDPVAEWDAARLAKTAAADAESVHPTLMQVIERFELQHLKGKISAGAIRYRLPDLHSPAIISP